MPRTTMPNDVYNNTRDANRKRNRNSVEPMSATSHLSDGDNASIMSQPTNTTTTTTNNNNNNDDTSVMNSLVLDIQNDLFQMGKALQCPICQSTVYNPVVLPCLHGFCKRCITRSISMTNTTKPSREKNTSCPICKTPCSKRSMIDDPRLSQAAEGYKLVERAFGFAPIMYDRNIDMTQIEEVSRFDNDCDMEEEGGRKRANILRRSGSYRSQTQDEIDEESRAGMTNKSKRTKQPPPIIECNQHLKVVKTVHKELKKSYDSVKNPDQDTSRKRISASQMQQEQELNKRKLLLGMQEKVMKSGQAVLVKAAVVEAKRKSLEASTNGGEDTSDDDADANTTSSEAATITSNTSMHIERKKNDDAEVMTKSQEEQTSMDELIEKEAVDRSSEWVMDEETGTDQVESAMDTQSKASFPMLACESSPAPPSPSTKTIEASETQKANNKAVFTVGDIVRVAPRTWPGVNKPGGVARITKVHADVAGSGMTKYDIAYVLGGREKQIDGCYMSLDEENEEQKDSATPRKKRITTMEKVTEEGAPVDNKKADKSAEKSPKKPRWKQREEDVQGDDRVGQEQGMSQLEELAMKRYTSLLGIGDSSRKKLHLNIVSSGLSEGEKKILTKFSNEMRRKVGVTTMKDFNPKKTNICITSTDSVDDKGSISKMRTVKAMRASLAGCPLVSTDWLKDCIKDKAISQPTGSHYIHTLPTKVEEYNTTPSHGCFEKGQSAYMGVMYLASQHQQHVDKGSPLLMSDITVMMCGTWAPKSDKTTDVQLLLRECGATLCTSVAQATKKLSEISRLRSTGTGLDVCFVFLCDDTSKAYTIQKALANKIRECIETKEATKSEEYVKDSPVLIVNASWLFDSISCATILEPEHYEPTNASAKPLWHLCRKKP